MIFNKIELKEHNQLIEKHYSELEKMYDKLNIIGFSLQLITEINAKITKISLLEKQIDEKIIRNKSAW